MGTLVKLCIVMAIGWVGITLVRQAFSNGIQTVIASEPTPTKFESAPVSTWDSDCLLGPIDGRSVNQNRCHAEAIRAKQNAASSPDSNDRVLDVGMTKTDSEHALLWFGGSMIALLLVLGAVGAGVMWMVKE